MRTLIVAAAIGGLLLVALGASTGHNSAPPPGDPDYIAASIQESARQGLLNTILLFGFAHVLAALVTTALPFRGALTTAAGWVFLAGVALFSGGLTIRMLLGEDNGLANTFVMLVPIGGVAFMIGWILLIAAAAMKRRES
jgi:uncharacterized membrane protein YgdD (TMEM256/DUF423 family)